MSWKNHLDLSEQIQLTACEYLVHKRLVELAEARQAVNVLRKRAVKRMERAAQKARKEDQ